MATPTLRYVEPTTPEDDLAFAPEPVEIYGLEAGGPADIADVTGLEARLSAIEGRLDALEGAGE